METLITVGISILTFLLGIVATAYGTKIGKAIEKRNELLDGLANWIDEMLTSATYFSGQRSMTQDQREKQFLAFAVKPFRWNGIVKSFKNKELSESYEEFRAKLFSIADISNKFEQSSYDDLCRKAADLHYSISCLIISDLPSWLFKKSAK